MNINGANALQLEEIEDLESIFNAIMAEMAQANPTEEIAPELVQAEAARRFKIDGPETLNWSLRKLAALTAQASDIEALAKAELDRINQWKAKQIRGVNQSREFFEALVTEYAAGRRAADAKYKGETTPYGRVGFRKQLTEWKYTDEKAAAEWLEANGFTDHVTKGLANKSEFKKAFEVKENVFVRDGKVIDGPHDYAPHGETVVNTLTAEVAEDVKHYPVAVVANGEIIPGVEIDNSRPDSITIKAEV